MCHGRSDCILKNDDPSSSGTILAFIGHLTDFTCSDLLVNFQRNLQFHDKMHVNFKYKIQL